LIQQYRWLSRVQLVFCRLAKSMREVSARATQRVANRRIASIIGRKAKEITQMPEIDEVD
jgi:hypothetical protein